MRLALGADKHNRLALRGHVLHVLARVFEHLERFLQVDNVNSVAFSENEFLHFGIPALRLVPEVDARFEQFLHGDIRQLTSFLWFAFPGSVLHPKNYIPGPDPLIGFRVREDL